MPEVGRFQRFLWIGAGLALAGTGCGAAYIANTDVPETDENRNIVAFCEMYRIALADQDITTLVSLASDQYYDNGGDVAASNDIDYAGLKDYLQAKFTEATGIRHEVRYRRVEVQPDVIYVYYTYSGSFRRPTFEGERWESVVAENRLELVPDGDSFKIVAGM